MIVKCGNIDVDTELTVEEIEKKIPSIMCSYNRPQLFFTQVVDGYERFFDLHYDKHGIQMKKITSWEHIPERERTKKVLKSKSIGDCYFSKNKKGEEKVYVDQVDFWNISRDNKTHWKRHWWN